MGYRNISEVLIHLDELCRTCSLFTSDIDFNGGYGCKSRSTEKQGEPSCHTFNCPLAYPAHLPDLKRHDPDLYEEHKEDFAKQLSEGEDEENCCPSSSYGSNWMVQWREVA